MSDATLTLTLDGPEEATQLFGTRDQHLRLVRDALTVRLIARGDTMVIEGTEEKVSQADRAFQQLRQMLRQQGKLSQEDVRTVLEIVQESGERASSPQNLTLVEMGRHV